MPICSSSIIMPVCFKGLNLNVIQFVCIHGWNMRATKFNWIPTFPKSYTFSASRWADAMYIKGEEKRKYYLSSLSPPKNSLRPKKKNWIQRTEAAEYQLGQKEVKKIYCNRPMTSNNSEASSAYWNLSVLIHVWVIHKKHDFISGFFVKWSKRLSERVDIHIINTP